jgi:hypothetical protein
MDVHPGSLGDDLLVPAIEGYRAWRAIAQQSNGGWIYTLPDEHW